MTEAQIEAIVVTLAEIREELKLLNKMTLVTVDRQSVLYDDHGRRQRLQEQVDHTISTFWKNEPYRTAVKIKE